MTDHANELRRYSRKIAHPAGDVPAVMRAAADEIARLAARLKAAEKERDALRNEIACVKEVEFPRKMRAVAVGWETKCARLEQERDALRAKIEAIEKRLRLILEEPENTMSNSKAMREMIRQARLALEESK